MEITDIVDNYLANDCKWNSEGASVNNKAASWRQQLLLSHHLSRHLNAVDRCEIFRQQYVKTSSKVFDDFLDDCVSDVELIMQKVGNVGAMAVEDWSFFVDSHLEFPCRGTFESCKAGEINHVILTSILKSSHNLPQNRASSKNVPTKRKLTENTTNTLSRQSIANFLVPPRDAKTATNSENFSDSGNVDSVTTQFSGFRTAREEFIIQNQKKKGVKSSNTNNGAAPLFNYGAVKKSLGTRRNVSSNFVPPVRMESNIPQHGQRVPPTVEISKAAPELEDERLVNIDPKMIEVITNEIMHNDKPVVWDDIAGLDNVKAIIKEAVVYPLMRPDLFEGPLGTPRGILLFGPPGTGKTMFGKCIASQSKSTFFNISASTLTSKWVGEGEKMVRALFAVAAVHQPSVIFIDEIDSLLCQRSDNEQEGTRRLKTEFMIQFDGAGTRSEDKILLVGATNRPQELDEAIRRRFTRRLYIPLPEQSAREHIIHNLVQKVKNNLSLSDVGMIGKMTDGYSAADVKTLCSEAFLAPLRSIPYDQIPYIKKEDMRPVCVEDFRTALNIVPPSVAQSDLKQYIEWNRIYGALR